LEVALRTHPNVVVLGEEVEHKREGLADLVRGIADLVAKRAEKKKNFGIVLIPEGLAAAIPELKSLTDELADVYKERPGLKKDELVHFISPWGRALLDSLPPYFRKQLLLEQTNAAVQLSQIETERLVAELVEKELERRTRSGHFHGKFGAVTSFLGYQARGAAPSNFDCDLGFTLGVVATCLTRAQRNGYLAIATGLKDPTEQWRVGGLPLTSLLVADDQIARHPRIPAAKVSLTGTACRALREGTEKWEIEEEYINPGPCQFAGPTAEERPEMVVLQNDPGYLQRLSTLHKQFDALRAACRPGCPASLLGIAAQSLHTLNDIVGLFNCGAAV
jgi:pyrophosphate--fructose-6-phosphate 1-phosphotransferase